MPHPNFSDLGPRLTFLAASRQAVREKDSEIAAMCAALPIANNHPEAFDVEQTGLIPWTEPPCQEM